MNNSYINQITLDCLLNKEFMEKRIIKNKEKQIDKKDFKFYRKRIFNLFKVMICNEESLDITPDVKYAYTNFIKSLIHYFKVKDNNDLLQEEYKEINNLENCTNDISLNLLDDKICKYENPDILLMRSVKLDVPTLDKYVKRISTNKKENIILPKQREINLTNPELKDKGIKKNINNKYESIYTKKEDK